MRLSKKESKYRIKIMQEFHLNKEAQMKIDRYIRENSRSTYAHTYWLYKSGQYLMCEAYLLRGLPEPVPTKKPLILKWSKPAKNFGAGWLRAPIPSCEQFRYSAMVGASPLFNA